MMTYNITRPHKQFSNQFFTEFESRSWRQLGTQPKFRWLMKLKLELKDGNQTQFLDIRHKIFKLMRKYTHEL
jgi:hypothetical protein